jgi:ADP-ribosylglycohydrolase
MWGAITGDIVGSVFEHDPIKTTAFRLFKPGCRFTDDTVLTVAVAKAIRTGEPYGDCIRDFGLRYPNRGYGGMFTQWLCSWNPQPYNSYGNGSAMRVSPVGFLFDTVDDVMKEAAKSAQCTHSHPQGIKGAQATALAILLARQGVDKGAIRDELEQRFMYVLDRSIEDIRPEYEFDVTCQGSVPQAITCFLEAEDYESSIRNAISLGGDADTQACIAGGIADAFYGVPERMASMSRAMLPQEFVDIIDGR